MNTSSALIKYPSWLSSSQFRLAYKRLILPIALIALIASSTTREITVTTLSDAFWAVSCYVAFTLAIYHYLSSYMSKGNALVKLYARSRTHQVFFASLLGALPGCGGAIVVTTQFISGRVGFGAIVAVLTSTMGDAAFLLLASKPDVGFSVILLGIAVGCLSGWVVNKFHADDFLRPKVSDSDDVAVCSGEVEIQRLNTNTIEKKAINLQGIFWKLLLIPAIAIAALGSFQVDINELFSLPSMTIEWLGTGLILLSMFLWSLTKELKDYQSTVSEDQKYSGSHPIQKAAQDTNFVTAWVIVAFLFFELTTFFAEIDISQLVSGWGMWMPLVGLAVGILPGCGPQILITSLYISGTVPLSTQLANSISNDGDALFPAIALAPKAALVATLYSVIPAFFVGYGYYFLFE
ncbi:putative manganese transporter [Vibrio sp. ZSDE26]|uniref:Manganese transporter n=1 Tax=Vibrio amylolyticus TaxID=2847292 RepID=A0A9X1XJA3_9VIBR|nr:putative manganese transporter [Vibrio amylolyticus]MCK6262878.1 putative manganese transporter [Vibrio amylolyticus]